MTKFQKKIKKLIHYKIRKKKNLSYYKELMKYNKIEKNKNVFLKLDLSKLFTLSKRTLNCYYSCCSCKRNI